MDNVPPAIGPVVIDGTAQVGEALTCSASVAGQSPRTGYQWRRANSDGSGEVVIVGAQAANYTLTAADLGKKVLCEISATDGGGTTKRKSAITDGPFAGGAVVGPKGAGSSATAPTGGTNGTDGRDGGTGASGTAAASVASAASAAAAAVAPCASGVVRSFGTETRLVRSYARSGLPLRGKLLTPGGEARAGRALELVQTVVRAGSAVRTRLGSVRTGPDGAFSISVPAGPSRALQVVDPDCGSVGPILTERVRGAVQARTTTRRVRNRQTARIRGHVLGGYVGRGIGLELQVKVGRQWRDVKHVTSNSRGDFKVGYRFMRTFVRYTYQFRVVTRAGGSWPYMAAKSRIVKVRVN